VGWIKVNTDGSFINTSSRTKARMVAHDENTRVIIASYFSLEPCEGAVEIEARETLAGLTHFANLGFRKIILEIDSAATLSALTKDQPDRSRLWWIHEEGKEILHKLQDSKVSDVYARVCSCRQCWASKCSGL
jgi:hypothetical protein